VVSVPFLVERFYWRIWETGDLSIADEILAENFEFRGSLGSELHGIEAFKAYVNGVRAALTEYNCEILDCVTEGSQAFARMRFSGRHVGAFRGFEPTYKTVSWMGAALFELGENRITRLWVLGELCTLDALLEDNSIEAKRERSTR
jgi:predicted ester cyclase